MLLLLKPSLQPNRITKQLNVFLNVFFKMQRCSVTHSFFVILSTLSDSRQREVGILLVCELCQFQASHASASNGTKCVIVIIVVAVTHLLCPLTSPTPSQRPFLPLQIVESSVNDTGKDFFLPLCSSKNTVVVSQWLLALSHVFMLFFSSHVEQMTWL